MKNFKRQHILIIPLLQEAYSGRKGVGFGSQGAGASTYYKLFCHFMVFYVIQNCVKCFPADFRARVQVLMSTSLLPY